MSELLVTEKKELVILLKPTIIDSDRAWEQDLRETEERIKKMYPPSQAPRFRVGRAK